MENFNDTAKNMAEDAVLFAMQSGIVLDYTKESAKNVDTLLGAHHDNLDKYDSDEGAKIWVEDDGLPILSIPGTQTSASPITKAHKRILNGEEDSIKSFVDVVFSIVNGEWPKTGVLRVPDVEMASGGKIEKIVLKESDYYISLVAEGKEDFVIFNSHDGFFQFYGVGNQFVCEAWFDLGGSRAYAMINPDCENTERVKLVTPFGQYTPKERDIISLEQLKTAVYEYFSNLEEVDFLAKVPHEKMKL